MPIVPETISLKFLTVGHADGVINGSNYAAVHVIASQHDQFKRPYRWGIQLGHTVTCSAILLAE